MSLDKQMMKRCFELALLGKSYVQSNPLVGAVIVYQARIIGEGWHEKYGGHHAEVNAVLSVKNEDIHLLPESTLYVSLEPCFHQGKTPPCVDLILKHKIKRVVISCVDVHEKVAGKSIEKLRSAGVSVDVGILEKEGKWLIRRFITFQRKKRPYIVLKWAKSDDGYIGKKQTQVWLTGKSSRHLVHKWRTEEMAIMVGTNTVITDNPKLTNRLYFGLNPLRVTIDRMGHIPSSHHILDGTVPTLYFTTKARNLKGVSVQELKFNPALLDNILEELHSRNIKSLLVEGGAALIQSFIRHHLWDEARVFTAPVSLGTGVVAPLLQEGQCIHQCQVGNDVLKTFVQRNHLNEL